MPSVSEESRAIVVEDLRKYFRVPGGAPRGILNRLTHPVQRGSRRTVRVLDGVSFDVRHGEQFGVIGRNGSGKSTLLRILGGIYRADSGTVRVSGSVAPFLSLGVGFEPQMSARQNIAVNGVMLGLGRREMRRRVDEVLAYSELDDYQDVQLKNFSSGMRVKLAFACMLQADPDVYLLDEVLAVGDEAFREKCEGEFEALKRRGKTVLLVSHRPGRIEGRSDRAMLLEDGRIPIIGDPKEVLERYRSDRPAETSGAGKPSRRPRKRGQSSDRKRVRRSRAMIETLAFHNAEDSDAPCVPAGEPLRLRVEAAASGWVHGPTLELAISGEDGTRIAVARDSDRDRLPVLKPGERLAAEVTVQNPLAPGRYRLDCALRHDGENRSGTVSPVRSLEFEVDGDASEGLVALERTVVLNPVSSVELVR